MKLESLNVFLIVADCGSLSVAAEKLGRSPSAVSMTLSQLEAEIGGKLFETERKNRLTPLGVLVREESRRATETFSRSTEAIRRHAQSVAGTIRIATVPSATVTLLPQVIEAFRRERPDVRLEVSDLDSATVRQRVQLDEADIGIVSAEAGSPGDGTVIMRDALGIVCARGGPIAAAIEQGAPVSWGMLEQETLISNPLCRLVGSDHVAQLALQSTLEARNTATLLALVRRGMGATVLPRNALPDDPGLVFVEPRDPPAERVLSKIRAADRAPSPAADLFWTRLFGISAPEFVSDRG